MKPAILKAMIDCFDADLQALMPDTNDDDFQDASVQLCVVQLMRNSKQSTREALEADKPFS